MLDSVLTTAKEAATTAAVRAALIGGSIASGSLFWVRATLGQNQLAMHDCTRDGTISIGGVSEQLYGEGFIAAWHEVLSERLSPEEVAETLYEMGERGARWEVRRAIDQGIWVPRLLKPLIGRPDLLEKVRTSSFYRALMEESLRILFRMIMTEGGWGVVEDFDLRARPVRVRVSNTPEPRRLGATGRCSCHLAAGIYAGYFETLFGVEGRAVETTCRSRGDALCTFEFTIAAEPRKPAAEAAPAAKPEPALAGK